MPVSKLLNFPLGSYLLLRLDYIVICGDELEAKIMRLIEQYMEDERRNIYRNLLNDPGNTIKPEDTIEITKDVWIEISHRTFLYDLYHLIKSENTLKRAIKSLLDKKFILIKPTSGKQYESPQYQINTTVVQEEFDKLAKSGKAGYQRLIPSKPDTIKNSPYQELPPSGYQEMTPSSQSRVSTVDTNSNKILYGNKETEEEEEEGAHAPMPPVDFLTKRNERLLEQREDEEEEAYLGDTEKRPAVCIPQTRAASIPVASSLQQKPGGDVPLPLAADLIAGRQGDAATVRATSQDSAVQRTASPDGMAARASGLRITRAPTQPPVKQGRIPDLFEQSEKELRKIEQRINDMRCEHIWAIVERELKTTFAPSHRRRVGNTRGMTLLLEDQVSDEKLEQALQALDNHQILHFSLENFHGWMPGLLAPKKPPTANGSPPATNGRVLTYKKPTTGGGTLPVFDDAVIARLRREPC